MYPIRLQSERCPRFPVHTVLGCVSTQLPVCKLGQQAAPPGLLSFQPESLQLSETFMEHSKVSSATLERPSFSIKSCFVRTQSAHVLSGRLENQSHPELLGEKGLCLGAPLSRGPSWERGARECWSSFRLSQACGKRNKSPHDPSCKHKASLSFQQTYGLSPPC